MLETVINKLEPIESITDETFDPGYAHRYSMLIQITDDGMAFMVLNHFTHKFIVLRDYRFSPDVAVKRMKEIFSSGEYFTKVNYKAVTVSYSTSKTTLVPSPFYDSDNRRTFLEFNHALQYEDVVHSNYVRAFDVYNVFTVNMAVEDLLKSTFRSFTLLHSGTPFMEGVHLDHRHLSVPGLFANVRKNSFELMATNGKQLLFYNNFHYETPEDFMYFILFVTEQLRMNPELNTLTLSGMIQKDSPEHSLLFKYFRTIAFADRSEQYNYHYKFEKLSPHTYFSVFSQPLCE